MIVGLIPLFGCFVCLILFYYISSWQRPAQLPSLSAQPAKKAGGFLTRAYHWVTTNFYNYAGPGLIGKVVHGPGLALLKYVEKITQAALSHTIVSHLSLATRWLRTAEQVTSEAWVELGHFAQLTHNALYHLRHITVPSLIRAAVAPVRAIAIEARTLATDAEGRLDNFKGALLGALAATGIGAWSTLQAGINGFVHAFSALHDKVWNDVVPKLNHAIAVTIPGILGGLDDLDREIFDGIPGTLGALRKWANDLENFARDALRDPTAWVLGLLGTAAGVIGLTGILAKIAPDLFCNNTKAVTKKLCGLDESLIAGLLAGALGLLIALDVEKIAHEAQDAYGAVDGLVHTMAGR